MVQCGRRDEPERARFWEQAAQFDVHIGAFQVVAPTPVRHSGFCAQMALLLGRFGSNRLPLPWLT